MKSRNGSGQSWPNMNPQPGYSSPISALVRLSIPHVWVNILQHLNVASLDSFRLTCRGFLDVTESALRSSRLWRKRFWMESTHIKRGDQHRLPGFVTSMCHSQNQVFLGMVMSSNQSGLYHLDLTSNEGCFRPGPNGMHIDDLQCSNSLLLAKYVDSWGYPIYPLYCLYDRNANLKRVNLSLPHVNVFSRLCLTDHSIVHVHKTRSQSAYSLDTFSTAWDEWWHMFDVPFDKGSQVHYRQLGNKMVFYNDKSMKLVDIGDSPGVLWTKTLADWPHTAGWKIQWVEGSAELIGMQINHPDQGEKILTLCAQSGRAYSGGQVNIGSQRCKLQKISGSWQAMEIRREGATTKPFVYVFHHWQRGRSIFVDTQTPIRRWIPLGQDVVTLEKREMTLFCSGVAPVSQGKRVELLSGDPKSVRICGTFMAEIWQNSNRVQFVPLIRTYKSYLL